MRSKFNKIFKYSFYFLTILLIQEIFFRFSFPLPDIKNFDRINYINWHSDISTNKYLRDQAWYWQSEPDTDIIFEHYMNRYGFRDNEWIEKKPKEKERIIFIGDSFVEGLMAKQDETITEGFINASGRNNFDVFNAGMMGMGLNSYLQLLADLIPIYKPDVVFFCIYANDLSQKEPAAPEFYLEPEYYKWYKPRVIELFQQYRTNGAVFFRWDNRTEPFLQTIPSASNPWTKDEEKLKPHVNPKLAEAMKRGKFNPWRTNSLPNEELNLKIIPKIGETIPFVKYMCEKFNVEPVVVYIPGRNQVTKYYYQFEKELCKIEFNDSLDLTGPEYQLHQHIVANQCKEFKVQFIDLTQVVKESEDKGQHLYWNYDEHMRSKGYQLLGKAIWDQWQKKSSLSD